MADLTPKQLLFVSAYCGEARFNGTEAARRARYKGNNVTLAAVAYENLRKPHLQEAIRAMLEDRMMSDEEAALIIAEQARGSIRPFVRRGKDGRYYLDGSTEDFDAHLHLIKEWDQEEFVIKSLGAEEEEADQEVQLVKIKTKIKLHDAQAAAHKIRQAHGAYGPTGRADDPLHAEIRFVVEDRRSGVEERKRQHERLLTNGTAG